MTRKKPTKIGEKTEKNKSDRLKKFEEGFRKIYPSYVINEKKRKIMKIMAFKKPMTYEEEERIKMECFTEEFK
jgi:Mg/Co/Ni transporter MgtE